MSASIAPAELPAGALLERYRVADGYVDCFAATVPGTVTLAELITAFYASRAFRPERWLLGAVLGRRADDADVARLARGEAEAFSAWTVEARRDDEILLCDFRGRTRSWLMVRPCDGGTRLCFGSGLIPPTGPADRLAMGALMGFHRWYSRRLLASAVARLGR